MIDSCPQLFSLCVGKYDVQYMKHSVFFAMADNNPNFPFPPSLDYASFEPLAEVLVYSATDHDTMLRQRQIADWILVFDLRAKESLIEIVRHHPARCSELGCWIAEKMMQRYNPGVTWHQEEFRIDFERSVESCQHIIARRDELLHASHDVTSTSVPTAARPAPSMAIPTAHPAAASAAPMAANATPPITAGNNTPFPMNKTLLSNSNFAELLLIIADALEISGALKEVKAGNKRRTNFTDPQSKWLDCHDLLFDKERGRARLFTPPFEKQDKIGSYFRSRMVSLLTEAKDYHAELLKEDKPITALLTRMKDIAVSYFALMEADKARHAKRKNDKDILSAAMDSYEDSRHPRPFHSNEMPRTSDLSFRATSPTLTQPTIFIAPTARTIARTSSRTPTPLSGVGTGDGSASSTGTATPVFEMGAFKSPPCGRDRGDGNMQAQSMFSDIMQYQNRLLSNLRSPIPFLPMTDAQVALASPMAVAPTAPAPPPPPQPNLVERQIESLTKLIDEKNEEESRLLKSLVVWQQLKDTNQYDKTTTKFNVVTEAKEKLEQTRDRLRRSLDEFPNDVNE